MTQPEGMADGPAGDVPTVPRTRRRQGRADGRPRSTRWHPLRDYCAGVTTPGARFIRDVFTLTTEEISDRWYGGQLAAPLFAHDDDQGVA